MKSTVAQEIKALDLPEPTQVVVIGGATMELHGLRKAHDIDMVISLKNWRYLRDEKGWEVYRKPDGRRYLQDEKERFDVWRWWFNPQDHSRTKLPELISHSLQHPVGFYYPTLMYLAVLKRHWQREKDTVDSRAIEHRLKSLTSKDTSV